MFAAHMLCDVAHTILMTFTTPLQLQWYYVAQMGSKVCIRAICAFLIPTKVYVVPRCSVFDLYLVYAVEVARQKLYNHVS